MHTASIWLLKPGFGHKHPYIWHDDYDTKLLGPISGALAKESVLCGDRPTTYSYRLYAPLALEESVMVTRSGPERDESEYLLLSGIQHYAYCSRQWALIHLESQWQENLLTFQGRALHGRVDHGLPEESRPGVFVCRSLPVASQRLGITGRADVVEFHYLGETSDCGGVELRSRTGYWQPYPVEYKRGRPKQGDWDAVQVCTQAMCLEEMLGVRVPEGAIFYGRTRRRQTIPLSSGLRTRVETLAEEMHQLVAAGTTPPVPKGIRGCSRCSLVEVCLPKARRTRRVDRYLKAVLSVSAGEATHA
jgi:CRISPR-associated exonuclease Cas4